MDYTILEPRDTFFYFNTSSLSDITTISVKILRLQKETERRAGDLFATPKKKEQTLGQKEDVGRRKH
ncbi:hypothetical protein CHS0354_009922 [Potamilus streckersoni]|uniref:Uncharacterized protein n=1 Tax=Potamilus streckersoni TaxID=2493646 RepID=A0AAE0TCQ6_9BIVA|nr:hypothetical protein CHS0354_009922 [Potamilus streckersoni]